MKNYKNTLLRESAGIIRNINSVNCDLNRNYKISVIHNIFDPSLISEALKNRKALIITTPTVYELYGSELIESLGHDFSQENIMIINCLEETKNIEFVLKICEKAIQIGMDRKGLLISFGGGVCSDIVSLAAALIRRGINHIRIPTTLIGQIDAAIGIKGGVNFLNKKNYLGCFYPPENVLIDPRLLASLPRQHIVCGFSEIIKIALLPDVRLFELVEKNYISLLETHCQNPSVVSIEVIWLSIIKMIEQLEQNIYENKTFKRLVDFGHTFSPLVEAASGFSTPHGEAVAIDMAVSTALALKLGYLTMENYDRIIRILLVLELPIFSEYLTVDLCMHAIADTIKHRGGALNLVIPTQIGNATFIENADLINEKILSDVIYDLKGISENYVAQDNKKIFDDGLKAMTYNYV